MEYSCLSYESRFYGVCIVKISSVLFQNTHICILLNYRTNIINASSEATRKVFMNAPTEITEQYEQTFLDDMGETVKSIMEDPMIVSSVCTESVALGRSSLFICVLLL